jgi:ABC-2 type transport system permease protein
VTEIPAARRLSTFVTFRAMFARELRVMRRQGLTVLLRVSLQPLLTVFVFAFVLPNLAGGNPVPRGPEFATILVPGMVATATMMTGMMSVIFPLVAEIGWAKEITDRLLAPLPVWAIAVQKILAGAMQALLAGLAVVPIALFVHAPGHPPRVHVSDWPMLVAMLVCAALCGPAIGLFLSTVADPQKTSQMFNFLLLPAAMLGCVYYPWTSLSGIRWLQLVVLANPVVYASEGLRGVLTPGVPHLPGWLCLVVLGGGALGIGYLATQTFSRRVLD